MKRWNGWGEETINAPLSAAATTFLQRIVGVGTPSRDATLAEVVAHVPPSRLPPHPLIADAPVERICHARGQSLPDWIALRSGCIDSFPDGVAYPEGESEVRDLLQVYLFLGQIVQISVIGAPPEKQIALALVPRRHQGQGHAVIVDGFLPI